MRTGLAAAITLGLFTLVGGVRVAWAQNRTEPEQAPVAGLFGHTGRSSMNSTFEVFGGYDHSLARFTLPEPETFSDNGQYVGGLANLSFARPIGRYVFDAGGASDFRYYPDRGELTNVTSQTSGGSMAISRNIGRRGTLRLSQTFASSSFYEFNPFSASVPHTPDELSLPQSDYQIQRGRTYNYGAQVTSDWRMSPRDTASLNYGFQRVWLPGELLSLMTNSAGARFNHRATRNISLVLGYGYELATRSKIDSSGYHRIESGIQYASHVFTRHTTVSASTGAAVVGTRDPVTDKISHVFDVTVNAALHHEVTRSWGVGLEYRREPQIVDFYTNPTYSDSYFASMNGRLSRRINVLVTSGYSMAQLDAGRGGSAHQTFFGTARGNWLLAHRMSAYLEYSYYRFHAAAPSLVSFFSQQIDRQAVRVGLNWSLPLLTPGARE